MKYFWWLFAVAVICLACSFIDAVNEAHGQDVYGSLLPSTVTRTNIGFQQFGSSLQINPVSRNVRPYDTQYVRIPYTLNNSISLKKPKKHPKDIICNKLNYFRVDIR